MSLSYSFIIPIYNRPDEVDELLDSLKKMVTQIPFEVVIIEDGSTISCDQIVKKFTDYLNINYLVKANSGPGDSRNYGMERAQGNYFIVLDSDCILPNHYLEEVHKELENKFVHCFGGPDAALDSFSDVQKAINYVMTSFLTTGGIRGGKKQVDKFQPRSFNLGISKEAFKATKGFGDIHPGEDPDLVLRLWQKGYQTRLFKNAYVYHKRRISWSKFKIQVHKFGLVRPILNKWHPGSGKITYWFPTLFIMGFLLSIILFIFKFRWPLYAYGLYISIIFFHSSILNKSIKIGALSVRALFIQFYGYGTGFLKSTIAINWLGKLPRKRFPHLFFN